MEGRQEHFNAPLGIILDLRKRHKDSRAGFCAPPPPTDFPHRRLPSGGVFVTAKTVTLAADY